MISPSSDTSGNFASQTRYRTKRTPGFNRSTLAAWQTKARWEAKAIWSFRWQSGVSFVNLRSTDAGVAQLAEQKFSKLQVEGSNPFTRFFATE
jgi:hypothetical protein